MYNGGAEIIARPFRIEKGYLAPFDTSRHDEYTWVSLWIDGAYKTLKEASQAADRLARTRGGVYRVRDIRVEN